MEQRPVTHHDTPSTEKPKNRQKKPPHTASQHTANKRNEKLPITLKPIDWRFER